MVELIYKKLLTSSVIGINSGLSYALLVSTFTAYLADNNIQLAMIGFLSLRTIPYSFKYLWSPFVDTMHIKTFSRNFGQRKSWLIATQACLIISIVAMGLIDIKKYLYLVCFLSFVTAFLAATYDIAMEAYRVEILKTNNSIDINSFNVLGFRIGFLISGAFGLYLSAFVEWKWVFITIASCMLPCMLVVFFSIDDLKHQPTHHSNLKHWFRKNVTTPFLLLFKMQNFYLVALVVSFYKLSDGYVDTMLIPFLLETGFSKLDIAGISKTIGMISTIVGTFAGGYLIRKFSLLKNLLIAEFLAGVTNLLFVSLVANHGNKELLTAVICIENFCAGVCNIALISYMSSLCIHSKFTATHYAILISISGLSRAVLGSTSGMVAVEAGWVIFFIISAFLSLPSIICIMLLKNKHRSSF
ncbi:MAG: MFS transporter [Alphaproteobacteria bacterium]|jgi:PAT family beta-lactamase induction signal transducer AmpG